ncbi:5-carboxymethyl-2-hydroxymuconate Delta-isomerase [Blastococcus sp. Marseille-P5729]|uniref:5-carboxymethyl-2-hydroxymuconate Delta-isomerase n=1 Tax=Blastococcus sp. Marseille-P5729 TaxID=2086582 RepID=UPI000D1041CA|nr:5-carboxymethyl-2-hydroxymuconate Delta-isomerase [Blastococcus sp. Marseille-P5729]
MPHVRINYSSNLPGFDAGLVIDRVVRALVDTGDFKEASIKARAYRADVFEIGLSSHGRGFVDAAIKVMPGRSDEAKAKVAELVCETIKSCGSWPKDVEVQISADVTDLSPAYSKTVVGSSAS